MMARTKVRLKTLGAGGKEIGIYVICFSVQHAELWYIYQRSVLNKYYIIIIIIIIIKDPTSVSCHR